MNNNEDAESGKRIIMAVYKAAITSLVQLGVTSEANVNRFSQLLDTNLAIQFEKIGLLPKEPPVSVPHTEVPQPDDPPSSIDDTTHEGTYGNEVPGKTTYPPLKVHTRPGIAAEIKELGLHPFTVRKLNQNGIFTIEELLATMQQDDLTSLKGIKEKSAQEIVTKVKAWNNIPST